MINLILLALPPKNDGHYALYPNLFKSVITLNVIRLTTWSHIGMRPFDEGLYGQLKIELTPALEEGVRMSREKLVQLKKWLDPVCKLEKI